VEQSNRHEDLPFDTVEFDLAVEGEQPRIRAGSGLLGFHNGGALKANDRVLLNFQVIFLNVVIPEAEVAFVTGGVEHQTDRCGLGQAIRIASGFSPIKAQSAIDAVAKRIVDRGAYLAGVGV